MTKKVKKEKDLTKEYCKAFELCCDFLALHINDSNSPEYCSNLPEYIASLKHYSLVMQCLAIILADISMGKTTYWIKKYLEERQKEKFYPEENLEFIKKLISRWEPELRQETMN